MKIIGKWSKSKGNILVNIPKIRVTPGTLQPAKIKYLGDPDDPVVPSAVSRDLTKEYGRRLVLVPTSARGGNIVEED